MNSTGFESGDLEFTEYTFTADQLPSFRSYRIKLVLTSTPTVKGNSQIENAYYESDQRK